MFLSIIMALLVALGVGIVVIYNRLVRDRNRVDGAWSDIDVQLQRRHDLIPQLVKAVDQYAGYERATIAAIAALRSEAVSATSVHQIGETELALSEHTLRLFALAENYPDLKANENFLELQKELVETEDYLQFARRYYNGAVRELNTRIETVPSNFVAGAFGYLAREYFQKASDDAGNVPLVELGDIGEAP